MTTFFTADHHFGHRNIIKFCNRPFSDTGDMDTVLTENWNSVVRPADEVFYVGDFTLGGFGQARNYLAELNGAIFVMPGSHDRWLSDGRRSSLYSKQHKVQILPPLYSVDELIKSKDGHGVPIVLCHYAMRSWDRSHYGSWHLFGHHHGNLPSYGLSFDIGVDCWNFFPVSFEQVKEKMETLSPIVDYSKGAVAS